MSIAKAGGVAGPSHMENVSLNDFGQVVYQFSLADGRSGIALYTIPEPASLTLLALGFAALSRRHRREPDTH